MKYTKYIVNSDTNQDTNNVSEDKSIFTEKSQLQMQIDPDINTNFNLVPIQVDDNQLTQEETEELIKLQQDLLDLKEIYTDLGKLVYEQDELIDESDQHIENTVTNIEEAVQNLEEANEQVVKLNKKKVMITTGAVGGALVGGALFGGVGIAAATIGLVGFIPVILAAGIGSGTGAAIGGATSGLITK